MNINYQNSLTYRFIKNNIQNALEFIVFLQELRRYFHLASCQLSFTVVLFNGKQKRGKIQKQNSVNFAIKITLGEYFTNNQTVSATYSLKNVSCLCQLTAASVKFKSPNVPKSKDETCFLNFYIYFISRVFDTECSISTQNLRNTNCKNISKSITVC